MFEKNNDRVEIRLNDRDMLLLKLTASNCGMSVSRFLRLKVDKAIRPLKDKINEGVLTYEDCETVLNNQLQFRKLFKK